MDNSRKSVPNGGLVAVQSDYGMGGAASRIVGSILSTSPSTTVYDVTSAIPKGDVATASCAMYSFFQFFPVGSVCLSLVGDGRPCVVKTFQGRYIVTPDNGTLTLLKKEFGIDAVREIDETVNRLKGTEKTSIFHGRDLFAYCAARLASGVIDFEGVGPEYPVEEIVLY